MISIVSSSLFPVHCCRSVRFLSKSFVELTVTLAFPPYLPTKISNYGLKIFSVPSRFMQALGGAGNCNMCEH